MPDPGWLLSQLSNPRNVFDILVVALIIYWLLWVAQGTRATQLIRGIVTLLAVVFIVGTTFQLTALNWVLAQTWPVLLISLPVIFQPEIRRALEQLGQTRSWMPQLRPRTDDQADRTVGELVKAATQLARHRYGALIVLERETGLQNYVERGVPIDGLLTRQLLINLFYPNSPLHDGAAVVRDGRIVAASVVLPLSDNTAATSQLGTRHRAALGITEQSDAIAVVVSEETGQISIAQNGQLIRNLDAERLDEQLRDMLKLGRGLTGPSGDAVFRAAASIALAFLLWAWVTTQRDPPEPRVFADLTLQAPTLPEPLQIAGELPSVTVEVIGPRSVVDRLSRAGLRPSLDLSEVTGPGNYQAAVEVELPPAARVDLVTPARVALVVDETTSRTMHLEVVPAQIDDPTRRIGEIVPEVSEVTVSGPKRLVDNVAQVVLPVDIGDRSDDFSADFVPMALDPAG